MDRGNAWLELTRKAFNSPPARASTTIRALNAAGYGVLVLGIENTLLHQRKSAHKTGGTPTPLSLKLALAFPYPKWMLK